MPDSSPSLDSLVQHASELYSLPRVAMQVLELTREPGVDAWKLRQCIEQDPALTAKLLRVVNSALFGLSRSVADLNQALAILGIKPLKLLVLGFSLPEVLFDGLAGEFLARYWRQSLVKAVAARELSRHVRGVSEDEAFIAALLQEIGTLVLIQHLGDSYLKLLELADSHNADVLCLERRTLGFDRTQLSARLLTQWQLPDSICAAARLPHSPREITDEERRRQPLRHVVYLADLLVRVLLCQQPDALPDLLEASRPSTDMDDEDLQGLVGELAAKVPQLAEVLSLKLPGAVDYRALLAQAYAQLAPVAGEAAAEMVRGRGVAQHVEELSEVVQDVQRRMSAANITRKDRRVSTPAAPRAQWSGSGGAPAHEALDPHSVAALFEHATGAAVAEVTHDAALAANLAAAVTVCRRRRLPLSLVMVQLDHVEELAERSASAVQQASERLLRMCKGLDHPGTRCQSMSEGCVAVVLAACERQQAVRHAHQWLVNWRRMVEQPGAPDLAGTTVSLGIAAVALPPRNFSPQELVASAARCLFGAQSSGGNSLKSIEL